MNCRAQRVGTSADPRDGLAVDRQPEPHQRGEPRDSGRELQPPQCRSQEQEAR